VEPADPLNRWQLYKAKRERMSIMKKHTLFPTTEVADSILPPKVLKRLPFSREALTTWNKDTDLHGFLFDLYEGTGSGDLAEIYMEEAKEYAYSLAAIFTNAANAATPAPAAKDQNIQIPEFTEDPAFGSTVKCIAAWRNLISNVLSEGHFFSLPHLLESETDLTCTVNLAADLYYRQAFQVLRGFIETIILPVHFCNNPSDYQKWKSNNYSVPSLRGDKGLLEKLKKSGVLSSSLADKASELYGILNGYIHGAETGLIHSGIPTANWNGHVFQAEKYGLWAKIFCESVELGIHVISLHLKQWEASKPRHIVFCNVCHNDKFATEEVVLSQPLIKYTCNNCGSSFHQTKSGERIVVTTIEFDE